MKRYIHEVRKNLSALPTWLKLMLTTVLIAQGAALGLLSAIITIDAVQLSAIAAILTKLPAHGRELIEYFRIGQVRSFYVVWLIRSLFVGNAIGFFLLGWMWFPMRKKDAVLMPSPDTIT